MPDVHVAPEGNLWACEIDGNIRSTHETQEEAIKEVAGWRKTRTANWWFTPKTEASARRTPTADPRNIPG